MRAVATGLTAISLFIILPTSAQKFFVAPPVPMSPIAPTDPAECNALEARFQAAIQAISQAHDDCLNTDKSTVAGSTCTKIGCQILHTDRDNFTKLSGERVSLCRADVTRYLTAKTLADRDRQLREQEARARAALAAARQQAERARLEERKAANAAAALAAQNKSDAARAAVRLAEANTAVAVMQTQNYRESRSLFPNSLPDPNGKDWRNNQNSNPPEAPSSSRDWKTTTAQKGVQATGTSPLQRVNSALDRFDQHMKQLGIPDPSTSTDSVAKSGKQATESSSTAEAVFANPNTAATAENLKNATAAAAESGIHDVWGGLKSNPMSSAVGVGTAVGGVLVNVGTGALDPDVAAGVKAIWGRRDGKHPADTIDTNEGTAKPK